MTAKAEKAGTRSAALPRGVREARVEVEVPLVPAAAWRLFTAGIARWWPKGFGTREDSRMVLDARPGGGMGESFGRGAGLEWYRVAGVEPGRWLLLFGDVSVDHGGPARTHLVITFEEEGAGTRVLLREVLFAGGSAALRRNLQEGWESLLAGAYAGAARKAAGCRRR